MLLHTDQMISVSITIEGCLEEYKLKERIPINRMIVSAIYNQVNWKCLKLWEGK